MFNLPAIEESHVTLIAEGCELTGTVHFSGLSRVHGIIRGEVIAPKGSTFVLGESGLIEGNIQGDTIVIEGFVQGDIQSKSKVVITRSGRVLGNINTGQLVIETGAFLEGNFKANLSPATA